jgi:iron(III) transport system substrate-binding protein
VGTLARGRAETTPVALCLLAAVAAATLILSGCPPREETGPVKVVVTEERPGAAQMDRAQILRAAKVEGELVWYTSTPEVAANAILHAFKAKYPFVRTRLARAGTFETIRQTEEGIKTGNVEGDVLHVLDVGIFIDLRRRGELLPYTPEAEASIRDQFAETGYWWAMRLVDIGMAYNRTALSAQRAPKTWEDLLRPEFAGKIGLKDAATAGTAYAEYYLLRERLGTLFWEEIARQHPRIYRSADEVMEALLRGEILVAGEMAGYAIYGATQSGKPIGGVWPKEGVPFIPGPIAILARAPHPNMGKLFVDYTLSREGQELCQKLMGTYSGRKDVAPLKGQPPLSSFPLLLTPASGWEDYLQKQGQLQSEFDRLFQPGTE